MSSGLQSILLDRFEPALQSIERRFGRTRRGALIQLGVTFIVLGLLLAILAPIFLPADLGLSRRGSSASLSLATFCTWGGAAIGALGVYMAWVARGMTDGDA